MSRLFRATFLAVAALLLTVGVPARPAGAQPAPGRPARNPDNPAITVDVGFGGAIWPNRWIPININVIGGAKAFEGELAITYAQTDRVGARIIRTVTATPGKTTTFGTLVNLPSNCTSLLITLRRPGATRPVATVDVSAYADIEKGEVPLPRVIGGGPLVVALGERQDRALASARSMADPDDGRGALGVANPEVCFVQPARLPPTWAALDSALLVATTGDAASGCDPRTLAAVREWVASGGRLVILATTPGEGWRNWLAASSDQPSPVSVAGVRVAPTPETLSGALGWRPPAADAAPEPIYGNVSPPMVTPSRAAEQAESIAHAETLTVRPVSLTPLGEKLGWTLRYPIDDDPNAACAAEGPLGFGWVVIMGFNPDLVSGTVTAEGSRRVWFDALENAVGDWRARDESVAAKNMGYMNSGFNAGGMTVSDIDAQFAGNMALDQLSEVPTLSNVAFPVLAAAVFVLAMLIGPVDAVLLRRARARHRSWATAIGWITLASIAAYFIPNVTRSGDTVLNRFTVIDASQVDAPESGPLPAWRSGLTGVFAGATFEQRFEGPLGGSWWRPAQAYPRTHWQPPNTRPPSRFVTTYQSLPDFSSLSPESDPWSGFVPAHRGAGGNLLTPASLKLWTFHTYQDQARDTTPIRAEVTAASESGATAGPPRWTVAIHGVPEGATIDHAALRVMTADGERWHQLTLEQVGDSHVASVKSAGGAEPPGVWAPMDPTQAQHVYYSEWGQTNKSLPRFSLAFDLNGPDRRGWAVTRAVKRGDAALYMVLGSMPSDVTLGVSAGESVRERHTQVLRLIVPVERSGGGADAEQEDSR